MKKILYLMSACIIFAACSSDDSFENIQRKSVVGNNTRTYDEALAVAQRAAGYLDEWDKTSSSSRRRIKSKSENKVICSSETRTSEDGLDTLMYIFNYEDNKGFAIVSANKATEELLAVTEEGNYTEDSAETDETGFGIFLELAENYIRKQSDRGPIIPIPFYQSDTLHLGTHNLISVKWGQEHPEGQYCTNGICGCSITAIAQIMSYYEYPQSISLTYPNADMSTQSLDWDDMKSHILYYNVGGNESPLYCSASDSAHNAIGRLCRQLGHLFQSLYNDEYTSTSPYYIRQPLINLGYNCNDLTPYTSGTSATYLEQRKPLYMRGTITVSNEGGHAWVVDGYERLLIHTTYFDGTQENSDITYNHINWGWNGINNGFFLDNVFDTSSYHSLDSSPYSPSASDNYAYNIDYYVPYI